jgi:hypothetical protein
MVVGGLSRGELVRGRLVHRRPAGQLVGEFVRGRLVSWR